MVARNGIRVLVGNGANTQLWEDLLVGNTTLKEQFPRLFSVSIQQNAFIDECGF